METLVPTFDITTLFYPLVIVAVFWFLYSKTQRKEITDAVVSTTVTVFKEANNTMRHTVAISSADRIKELNDIDLTTDQILKARETLALLLGESDGTKKD